MFEIGKAKIFMFVIGAKIIRDNTLLTPPIAKKRRE